MIVIVKTFGSTELYPTNLATMRRTDIPDLISFLLILMFSYAAFSKLIAFNNYKIEMHRQPVPKWSVDYLIVLIPASELVTIAAMLFRKTRMIGFFSAAFLMLVFTVYVVLAMTGAFGKVPCACGGIINNLSWGQHLVFNLIFLSLSVYGVIINEKERRFIGK
ncbi:Methylamine utilisation protein MauE [Mucilaginibacter gossypiicola]|uniref:Methylamine utilisation protein MauE n=1 Tax=Mucilaginibacter gossypiicola TaxID=551995 RepID=A0A1H8D2V9_9SPHI|nr:MauE/DoxX family redox-associated membrane protein [Mucilaginibacter gossypiicola]SEN01529.1 Methylamine utilisation protein MauE [Mucilaginibacter gossypiicola]